MIFDQSYCNIVNVKIEIGKVMKQIVDRDKLIHLEKQELSTLSAFAAPTSIVYCKLKGHNNGGPQ